MTFWLATGVKRCVFTLQEDTTIDLPQHRNGESQTLRRRTGTIRLPGLLLLLAMIRVGSANFLI